MLKSAVRPLVALLPALIAMLALATAVSPAAAQPSKSSSASKATAAKATPRSAGKRPVAKAAPRSSKRKAARAAPPRPSVGQLAGLRSTEDDLDLRSSVAFVVDKETDEVLFSKNSEAVLPIASITKLMTALVVTDAALPLDEKLAVTQDDVNATMTSGARSRLRLGTQLTRGEMLHLALMASENRAAHVLGRSYPGGMPRFVEAMNAKAALLGMHDTRYVEPTGLSSDNRSSAQDLARLVRAASVHPVIREFSTSQEAVLPVGPKQVQFRNTNGLVRNPEWDILVQKTGYIAAAGRCVVMQAQMAGRQLIMVLLDSAGKYSRIGDAERLRRFLAESPALPSALAPALRSIPALPSLTSGSLLTPALQGGAVGPYVAPVPILPSTSAAVIEAVQPR